VPGLRLNAQMLVGRDPCEDGGQLMFLESRPQLRDERICRFERSPSNASRYERAP